LDSGLERCVLVEGVTGERGHSIDKFGIFQNTHPFGDSPGVHKPVNPGWVWSPS